MKERVVAQLRPLSAVRATTTKVFERAKKDESKFFNVNMDKLPACADFVMDVMKEAYPGRFNHTRFCQSLLALPYSRKHSSILFLALLGGVDTIPYQLAVAPLHKDDTLLSIITCLAFSTKHSRLLFRFFVSYPTRRRRHDSVPLAVAPLQGRQRRKAACVVELR
jgi:hypothetical protein